MNYKWFLVSYMTAWIMAIFALFIPKYNRKWHYRVFYIEMVLSLILGYTASRM
jgi:hypothetical protein